MNNTAVNIDIINRFHGLRVIQKRYSKIEIFTKKYDFYRKTNACVYRIVFLRLYLIFFRFNRHDVRRKTNAEFYLVAIICIGNGKKIQAFCTGAHSVGIAEVGNSNVRSHVRLMHPFALLIIFRGNYTCH